MGGYKNPATEYEGGSPHQGWQMGRRRGYGNKKGALYPIGKVRHEALTQGAGQAEDGEEKEDEKAAEHNLSAKF